jgi:hypothetical protein
MSFGDGKPCPKCGSTNWWCDCCPACGEKHHLRDCPNPVLGRINLKPLIEELPAIKESVMEKLGVQVDDNKTKTASEKKTCPECGAELLKDSNVPQCPNCGTKPFEKKKEK